jgi:hypothetical protein
VVEDKVRGRVSGGVRKEVQLVTAADGRQFPVETDKELNRIAHQIFGSGPGASFLVFLESITLRSILPPTASDAVLRDHEGQRRLVAMIRDRVKKGAEL